MASLGPGVQFSDAAGAAHQQGEGQVGGAFGEHVGGVGEQDPALIEVGQVIVVVAHRYAGYHLQVRGALQLLAPELATDSDQPVGVGQGFVELCVDIALGRARHDHVEVLLQALDHLGRDTAEGKYGFFHRARLVGEKIPSTLTFLARVRRGGV
ncbi:hypothetical protein D3C78_1456520 [compost metagenome]